MKNFYESKTFWMNVLIAIVAILTLLSQQEFISAQYAAVVVFLAGALNIVLRVFFTESRIKRW